MDDQYFDLSHHAKRKKNRNFDSPHFAFEHYASSQTQDGHCVLSRNGKVKDNLPAKSLRLCRKFCQPKNTVSNDNPDGLNKDMWRNLRRRQILLPKVVLILVQWMNFVCSHHAEEKETHLRLTAPEHEQHMPLPEAHTCLKLKTPPSLDLEEGVSLLHLQDILQCQQHTRKDSMHQKRIWGCSAVRKGFLLSSLSSDNGQGNFCHHCFEKTSQDQHTYRSFVPPRL